MNITSYGHELRRTARPDTIVETFHGKEAADRHMARYHEGIVDGWHPTNLEQGFDGSNAFSVLTLVRLLPRP